MTDGPSDSLARPSGVEGRTAGSHAMRLYSIPAGTEFIPVFVKALLAQKIIPGFPASDDTLALSRARIFVPTRRAARAMASEIARQLGANSAILPQILPLGSLAEAEDASLFDPVSYAGFAAAAAQPAMPELERRLLLTHLIIAWGKHIRNAILSVDAKGNVVEDDNEPFVVTKAPGQAFHLAGELGALIDEMIIEGVEWRSLHTLAPESFDRYWSITLDFLKIAMESWPKHLAESGRVDEVQRNVLLAEAEAERLLQIRPVDPFIVAGSTGTNAATAQLMGAIARLPNGAVVLPGLDCGLSDETWAQLAKSPDIDGSAGHPQNALARLLTRLRVVRANVAALGEARGPVAARMDFLAQALLPAEATDSWNDYRKHHDTAAIDSALAGVCYMDAENERHEALAIAIVLREVLETDGRTAALITPDRNLARRVRSELLRWNVVVDDSGGDVLKTQAAGVLARLALELAQGFYASDKTAGGAMPYVAPDPAVLIALLNHDRVRLGWDHASIVRIARLVECGLIRGPAIDLRDVSHAVEIARDIASDHHAHPLKKSIDDQDWSDIAAFLYRLQNALSPLATGSTVRSPGEWFSALRDVIAVLIGPAEGDAFVPAADDDALQVLFEDFIATPDPGLLLSLTEFAAFFDSVAQEARVRGPQQAHPRIKILGLLEARLLSADVKILAGLDEGIWPPAARMDAFLNRPMRAELGLSPPERRIGQTAHDFVEAMGADHVVITRSRKRAGAPAIPSRLIQRIAALAGERSWDLCRERGQYYLHLASHLDRPAQTLSASRPEPRPDVSSRPERMSVTQIETWRRDPYAIYARRILDLQPFEEAGVDNVNADIGNCLHAAIEKYQAATGKDDSPEKASEQMAAIAAEVFGDLLKDINIKTFRWPRIQAALDDFVTWESERREGTSAIAIEQTGRMEIKLADDSTFTLVARADRIEKKHDGTAALVDYKSSRTPSAKVMEAGFAPQLTLEAAIVEAGGFDFLPAGTPVEEALYLALLGADGVKENIVGKGKNVTRSLEDLKAEHLQGLISLANQFRNYETAYVPRPYPQFINEYGEYDHLSRVKEWSGGSSGEDT